MTYRDLQIAFGVLLVLAIFALTASWAYQNSIPETPQQKAARETIVKASKVICPKSTTMIIDMTEDPHVIACR